MEHIIHVQSKHLPWQMPGLLKVSKTNWSSPKSTTTASPRQPFDMFVLSLQSKEIRNIWYAYTQRHLTAIVTTVVVIQHYNRCIYVTTATAVHVLIIMFLVVKSIDSQTFCEI